MINNRIVPIVNLGNDRNYFRQQFSAVHELGHVLTDGLFEVEELTKLEYKNMEQYMNQFAGALLIPKNMFLNDLAGRGKTEFRFRDIEQCYNRGNIDDIAFSVKAVKPKHIVGYEYPKKAIPDLFNWGRNDEPYYSV